VRKTWPAGVLVAVLVVAGCSGSGGSSDATGSSGDPSSGSPSPVRTITLPPVSTPPLSGKLTAELQQSSRDVALNRFQVWITNGTPHDIVPTRIVYHDAMLTHSVVGGRLRPMPSGSHRGFTLDLIEPTCDGSHGKQTVTVSYAGTTETLPIADETSVVGRWSDARCEELAVARIATLEWTGVKVEGSGSDAIALFELTATPTGRPGGVLHLDTVGGTPIFTAADGDFFTVDGTVRSDGEPQTFDLRAQPARCDPHGFGDSGGATNFLVNLRIDGRGKGQIPLRMSPKLSAAAFAYAAHTCGF
jgi:hypothetical protein